MVNDLVCDLYIYSSVRCCDSEEFASDSQQGLDDTFNYALLYLTFVLYLINTLATGNTPSCGGIFELAKCI